MARERDDDATEDHGAVSAMADRLKLKGRRRDDYIDRHMRGLGYRSKPTYYRDEDDDDDSDSFFGSSRKRRRDDDDEDF